MTDDLRAALPISPCHFCACPPPGGPICVPPWHFYGWYGLALAQCLRQWAQDIHVSLRLGERWHSCCDRDGCVRMTDGTVTGMRCRCGSAHILVDMWRHERDLDQDMSAVWHQIWGLFGAAGGATP